MKKPWNILFATCIALSAIWAGAAVTAADTNTLSVTVKDQNNMPVRDAVVMVYPASGTAQAIRFPWAYEMEQKNIAFQPGTLVVPTGATVRFPNRDRVRHNIYSFSKIARFDMKLYGRDDTRSYRFGVPGIASLGCNIHDTMKGYIRVVDTPYADKTDVNGRLVIRNLPSGQAVVKIWHPGNRVRGGESQYTIAVSSGANSRSAALKIR